MSNLSMLENDSLIISGRTFSSRLMLGTGKYQNFQEAKESILLSGCEILTVAVRRAQSSNVEGIDRLLNNLDWTKIWLMPNTAGCQTAEQAIRLGFLSREILKNLNYTDNNFLKLEVIPDPKYLLPDSLGTLTAAEYLISKNFALLDIDVIFCFSTFFFKFLLILNLKLLLKMLTLFIFRPGIKLDSDLLTTSTSGNSGI